MDGSVDLCIYAVREGLGCGAIGLRDLTINLFRDLAKIVVMRSLTVPMQQMMQCNSIVQDNE